MSGAASFLSEEDYMKLVYCDSAYLVFPILILISN